MKFSDLFKMGSGKPAHTDIPKGGLAIDVEGKKAYSKDQHGVIFALGVSLQEVLDAIGKAESNVPIGGIIQYSGALSKIPVSWALCNGRNGTPDLVHKFALGTDDQSQMGHTGGSADSVVVEHTHKTQPHKHTGTVNKAGAHKHKYSGWTTGYGGNVGYDRGSVVHLIDKDTTETGSHEHSLTIGDATVTVDSAGVTGKNANLPPYVKLAYIMRKS